MIQIKVFFYLKRKCIFMNLQTDHFNHNNVQFSSIIDASNVHIFLFFNLNFKISEKAIQISEVSNS